MGVTKLIEGLDVNEAGWAHMHISMDIGTEYLRFSGDSILANSTIQSLDLARNANSR